MASKAARIVRTTVVLPVPAPPLITQTPQVVAMKTAKMRFRN
jgi:hypothetical protein